jgi:hypothetical protein
VVSWDGGRVSVADSVEVRSLPTGRELREAYTESLRDVTFGAIRARGDTVMLGPLTLLRFGHPEIGAHSVEWPIEGGLLARRGGGTWRVAAGDGAVTAEMTGFAPRLPRVLYGLTHLHVHQLFTRLYLLHVRGREPAAGIPATSDDRFRAATVDLALCFTLAGGLGPGRRLRRTVVVAAVYHVACWALAARTVGSLVMRQRVVSIDGGDVSAGQALMRLIAAPAAWVLRRPVHDRLAGTDVIVQR